MTIKTVVYPLLLVSLFSGCVPKINKADTVKKETVEKEMEKDLEHFRSNDIVLKNDWWDNFKDPQLNELIKKALLDAPSLKTLEARYAQANSLIKMHESKNLPNISFDSSVSRLRFSENYIFPAPMGGGRYDLYNMGFSLDYDFDFWNSRGSLIKGVRNSALSQMALLKVKELSITTALSTLYISWNYNIEKLEKLELIEKLLQEKTAISEKIFENGLSDEIYLNGQKTALEQTRQLVYKVETNIDSIKKSIGIIGGFLPSYVESLKQPNIDGHCVSLPRNLHLDILSHRPDIAVEKYLLLSKEQFIEHSKAKFYPNISLRGLFNLTSFNWSKMFDRSSVAPLGGVALSLPLFDAGAREANLKKSVDDYNAQVHTYNGAIVKAVNEIVTTLKELEISRNELESNAKEITIKESVKNIEEKRFLLGLKNKIPYLDSEISLINTQLSKAVLKNRELSLQIELIRSLGGGYVNKGQDESNS